MAILRRIAAGTVDLLVGIVALPFVLVLVPLAFIAGAVTTVTGGRRRHEEAWAPFRSRNSDGLTSFQVLCEQRLIEAVAASGVNLGNRTASATTYQGKPSGEIYLEWSIEGTPLTIGVYPAGAGIWGPKVDDRFEEWDASTPEELIEIVCKYCVRRATAFDRKRSNTPLQPTSGGQVGIE